MLCVEKERKEAGKLAQVLLALGSSDCIIYRLSFAGRKLHDVGLNAFDQADLQFFCDPVLADIPFMRLKAFEWSSKNGDIYLAYF